jgi:hypothetical protein
MKKIMISAMVGLICLTGCGRNAGKTAETENADSVEVVVADSAKAVVVDSTAKEVQEEESEVELIVVEPEVKRSKKEIEAAIKKKVAEATPGLSMEEAYRKVMEIRHQEADMCMYYFTYDITHNGTPELWIKEGDCEAEKTLHIYTYSEKKGAKKIFETGSSYRIQYYPEKDYILGIYCSFGASEWYKISYERGRIREKLIYEEFVPVEEEDKARLPPSDFIQMELAHF